MNTDRIDPQFTEAPEAVVTYSRVPSRGPAPAGGRALVERVEPRLDASEVPLIDPHDEVDAAFAAPRPELRADTIEAAFAGNGRRGGSMRVVVLGAALAIVAGFGVLAATIGVATIIPGGSTAAVGPVAETPLRLTDAEAAPEMAVEPSAVREVPLAAGEEAPAAEASATIVAPPLPRPRPEVTAASLEAEAGVFVPPADPEFAGAPGPRALGSEGGDAASPSTAASGPQAQSTDALITSIEATLNKVDSTPGGAATPPAIPHVTAAPPAVLPPPSLDPLASAPRSSYPPLHDDCPPPSASFEPCYDVMPPEPLTDNGYYQAGPVPPASVPYPYPPADSDSYEPFVDGSTSLGEAPESAAERRPGIVRRTITRTADAVGRAFSRNQ